MSMAKLPLSEERKFVNKHGSVSTRKVNTQFEDGDYGTKGASKWNPQDFGDTPRKVEPDGQGQIFFDDSIEPPDPDDYPSVEKYEQAHKEFEERHPPKPTKDNETLAREVVLGVVSNMDILSKEQLTFVRKRASETLKSVASQNEWLGHLKRDFVGHVSEYSLQELQGLLTIITQEIEVRKHLGDQENAHEKTLVS